MTRDKAKELLRKFARSKTFVLSAMTITLGLAVFLILQNVNTVYINDEGSVSKVYTMYEETDAALRQAGITLNPGDQAEYISLGDNAGVVRILREQQISIIERDGTRNASFANATVSEVLASVGITLEDEDRINIPLGERAVSDAPIVINRVDYNEYRVDEPIKHEIEYKETPLLANGKTRVISAGQDGVYTYEYRDKLEDGVVIETTLLREYVSKAPVKGLTLLGNRALAPISELTPPPSLEIKNGAPTAYRDVMRGAVATAYSARAGAKTASGRYAISGHVAVRPGEIPYGTELYIVSSDGKYVYGYAVAADTGVALREGIIDVDLFFETYRESALWGKKAVDIYIL